VADVARTSYVPLTRPDVRVGLVIETRPTGFVRRFAKAADRQGPYQFDCGTFTQRYDDCIYVPLNHTELYPRFAELWPDVRAFIRGQAFTLGANRIPPAGPMRLAIGQ